MVRLTHNSMTLLCKQTTPWQWQFQSEIGFSCKHYISSFMRSIMRLTSLADVAHQSMHMLTSKELSDAASEHFTAIS